MAKIKKLLLIAFGMLCSTILQAQTSDPGVTSTGNAGGNHAFRGTYQGGIFSNWMNSGASGTAYNLLGANDAHGGFGMVVGSNIVSPVIWMYSNFNNAFSVRTMVFQGDMTSGLDLFTVRSSGNVGIGTTTPGNKLEVNGTIRSKEIIVEVTGWPDYVFEENYSLPSLSEIEAFIKANKHLPEVPSAKEVEENGIQLGEMNRLLLKKLEELTLHMIEMKKENEELKKQFQKIAGER